MNDDKDALIYLADVRIDELEAENAKLREDLEFERSENGWAREFLNRMGQKCGTKDCPSLVAYVTKIEYDNAKLRHDLEDANNQAEEVCIENAKLRELVRDMLACINNVSAHDTYCWDYCDFCKMYETKGRCDFESRMRELGVEV